MASGHVNRIKRPDTWLHRPMLQDVKKVLANPEPSTHDTFRTRRDVRFESVMRSKADLGEGNVAACTINRRRHTAWAPLRALASPDLRRPPSPRRERARAFGLNRACRTTPRTQPCGSIPISRL